MFIQKYRIHEGSLGNVRRFGVFKISG